MLPKMKYLKGIRILILFEEHYLTNQIESFMIEVYDYCQRIGLTPQDIASNLQALINLSKDIPFSKIPEHIKEKKKEKTQIEENIKTLEDRKGTLEIETSTAKEIHDVYLQEEKTTIAKLKQYSNFKTKLRKFGMPID